MSHYPKAEISWFSALCDDDYQFLSVEDPSLKASWPHCRDIALTAEKNGFDNILLPSGYTLGMDSIGFAGGIAPLLEKMRLLVAVRCGEMWVPQLARELGTLDQRLGGGLTINMISSDLPGQTLDGGPRYQRTREIMQALRMCLNGEAVRVDGDHIQLDLEPPRMQTVSGNCPPFYFGGLSPAARDVAAQEADVFLMWPDTMDKVSDIMDAMRQRASGYDRTLEFGYRAHGIVRETAEKARDAADAGAGPVVEIQPDLPKRRTRQRVELHAVCAGRKMRHGQRNMAAQDACKSINRAAWGRAALYQNSARDIGCPLLILAATINQIKVTGLNAAIGFFGDAIMHNRAIRASAGDGVKAQIQQLARCGATGFGVLGGASFRHLTFCGMFIAPCEASA